MDDDDPALTGDEAAAQDAGLHGGLPDDEPATPAPRSGDGSTATSAEDVDAERSGPS